MGVRVNQQLYFPQWLFRFLLGSTFRPNVTLACYQQAGRVGSGSRNGKYVDVSGK
jgi:hypothetical protein